MFDSDDLKRDSAKEFFKFFTAYFNEVDKCAREVSKKMPPPNVTKSIGEAHRNSIKF